MIARRSLVGAALLGILADPLLRNGPWGVGLLVWMAMFAALVVALASRSGAAFSRESRIWLAVAVLFAAGLSWRDADMLYGFDVLAMLAALTLLAMSMNAIPVAALSLARVRDLIQAAFGTSVDVAFGAVPLVARDAEFDATLRERDQGRVRRVGRALVIAVPVVLVFTLLFVQADPVFGSLVWLPDIDFSRIISHTFVAGFFAWVVAGWLRRALLPSAAAAGAPDIAMPFTLGATDLALVLGALNLLFAVFVVVQIRWLFGGEALVLRTTNLSYAEYARRGFFELTTVAALLLPVLLCAQALVPDSHSRTLRLYRRLALPLVVLLGAVMASAGARMRLYVGYYGISADRLYASAFMIWLAIVFVWLAATVLRSRPRGFAIGLVASGFLVLFTLNVLSPDALVARAIIARGTIAHAGAAGSDLRYLSTLGGDAMPLLVPALIAPNGASDTTDATDRCGALRNLLDRWTRDSHFQMVRNWPQWNFARMRAMETIRTNDAALRRLPCALDEGQRSRQRPSR